MNGPGLFWMLQTAAGLSMAGPMFIIGVEFLRSGQYVFGIAFLTFGTIALYLPTYLINQIGGPRTWVRRWLSRATTNSTDGSDTERDEEQTEKTEGLPLIDRFRDR